MSNIYETHKPETTSGVYLRLKDGESVKIRIASEPIIYQNEYQDKISAKYAWIVWNIDAKKAQIFQQSATFFKSLANYATDPEYGSPDQYDIKITRQGEGTETIYHILPARKSKPLDTEAREAVKGIDLIDSVRKGQGVSNVFWLSDFVEGKTDEVNMDEPITKEMLDSIPF